MDLNRTLLIGDYVLGQRIGSGSFAVVWRSKHRQSGREFAVKEIDKQLLSAKVSENLLKEISILSTIDHPNIIRLFESIETESRIFLVLEYCEGGDLASYIHRHGKVSETVARHFMRQLAAGLQVLQEKHLIHRDLKPQNLLLSSNEATPQLKIGDFGFARSLTPHDLADTLCGSPLYMAPEIIRNQKYDAKADLWSVGAILFQLVTGKPPFDGNSQYQLFQNILTSTELRFPQGALQKLHPDCVDLCRSLLRHNPVERLTFMEFFNHKFLGDPRLVVDVDQSSSLPQMSSWVEQFGSSASDKRSELDSEHPILSATRNLKSSSSSLHDNIEEYGKDHCGTSGGRSVLRSVPNIEHDADLMQSIEKGYVLVNHRFSSMENFSYCLETSLQDDSTARVSPCPPKKNDKDSSIGSAENPPVQGSNTLAKSCASALLMEMEDQSLLDPSTRLRLLHQNVQAVVELAQEKYNAGLFLESFSVELVVLAVWKRALQICSSWQASRSSELPESSTANESKFIHGSTDLLDFTRPSHVIKWAEQGFINAYNLAEKLSYHLQDIDATTEMPDAMEIIFQEALAFGTSGAVYEYMENKGNAVVSYTKAILLLSFIMGEATSLPLNPPFSLTPANKKRIQSYIINLWSRHSHFSTLQQISEQSQVSYQVKTPDV